MLILTVFFSFFFVYPPFHLLRGNPTELSSPPKIFDAEGKLIKSEAGPFLEGHELFLSCQVDGGTYLSSASLLLAI